MFRKIKRTDYPDLIKIWERAVLNTHDFLREEDFKYHQEQIPNYFEYVKLFGYEYEETLVGFMGLSGENLEMLFIHHNSRGKEIEKN